MLFWPDLHLDHFFDRHQDLAKLLLHAGAPDALGQSALHGLFSKPE
jgi:hypothetical protein